MSSRPFCHRKVSTRKVLGLERRVRRIFFSYRSFLFGLMLCTCSYAVYMFAVCINLLLYWPHGGRWSRLTSHWPGHMCSFHGTFGARRPVRDRYGLAPPCTSPAAEDSLRLGSILAVGPSPYRSRTGLRASNVPWNEHMCPGQWLVSRLPSLAPWPYYGLLCDRPDNIFLTEHTSRQKSYP